MPNNFCIHIHLESMESDFPEQTVVMARKLGLLRKQKFRFSLIFFTRSFQCATYSLKVIFKGDYVRIISFRGFPR
jgi:hypothetical protein